LWTGSRFDRTIASPDESIEKPLPFESLRNSSGIVMPGRLSIWAKVVLGCLTLWALVVILPDFGRVFDQSFNNKLPFEADNDGALTDSAASASLGGCQAIDLQRNYCGGRMSDLLAVFGGMGGTQYVWRDLKSVSLYFRCTGAPPTPPQEAAAAQIAHPYTPLHVLCAQPTGPARAASQLRTVATKVDPLSLVARAMLLAAQASAVLFIVLAFWLVLSRPSPATWGFFFYAIWFNPGQYYVFYAWLQHWSRRRLPYRSGAPAGSTPLSSMAAIAAATTSTTMN
jgi:hypothetical protein